MTLASARQRYWEIQARLATIEADRSFYVSRLCASDLAPEEIEDLRSCLRGALVEAVELRRQADECKEQADDLRREEQRQYEQASLVDLNRRLDSLEALAKKMWERIDGAPVNPIGRIEPSTRGEKT